MKVRIVRHGIRYIVQRKFEDGTWATFSTVLNKWCDGSAYPKRFWTKHGAKKFLKSLGGFDV